jgi:hypothetical protein
MKRSYRKRISTASYLGGEYWTADLGAPSQVNPVVGRHQVEIEAAGNPSEYTPITFTRMYTRTEKGAGERETWWQTC